MSDNTVPVSVIWQDAAQQIDRGSDSSTQQTGRRPSTDVRVARISHTGAPPLIGTATRPSDEADPRRTQKRVAVSGSGRQVLVDITSEDRLRLIHVLPGRWPEVVKARERGDSLQQIHRWARIDLPPEHECRGQCEAPCLRCYLAEIYAWLETELHELANRRGALLP